MIAVAFQQAYVMRLRVSLAPVVSFLLLIAIFAGFQGGRYFYANRMQELGIACALCVFLLGAWLAVFRLEQSEWKRWVYFPLLAILGIMVLWSAVYAIRFDENFIYCLFASREFMIGFIGPGIFLVCSADYSRKKLERVIWMALCLLMLNYLA